MSWERNTSIVASISSRLYLAYYVMVVVFFVFVIRFFCQEITMG